jgi:4,5-DOPA dioxygenase extradiol
MSNQQLMPATFIGHGSPMNTLESNRYTSAWRELGRRLPRPKAILSISAHWFIKGSAVTAMERPRVIHDFYGFPRELFAFDYPAPGAPELAEEIADLVKPSYVGLDHDSWGLDHGTWSVLAHVFPDASVPVLQLSLHAEESPDYHIELGRKLGALREQGVFIMGSGNVVHNLRLMNRAYPEHGYDWAERFDQAVQQVMTESPGELARVSSHPDYRMAVPTPEHFMPLYYLAGLCQHAGEAASVFVEGAAMGSLTMTSYGLGLGAIASAGSGSGANVPASVPPEQTNI